MKVNCNYDSNEFCNFHLNELFIRRKGMSKFRHVCVLYVCTQKLRKFNRSHSPDPIFHKPQIFSGTFKFFIFHL